MLGPEAALVLFTLAALLCKPSNGDIQIEKSYNRFVQLFYQDWTSERYGKVRLTAIEKKYYERLSLEEKSELLVSPEESTFLLHQITVITDEMQMIVNRGEHSQDLNNLLSYLYETLSKTNRNIPDALHRMKRQTNELDELITLMSQLGNLKKLPVSERRQVRQSVRQKINDLGLWPQFLRLRRKVRQERLNETENDTTAPPPPSPDNSAPPPNSGVIAAPPDPDRAPDLPYENIPVPDPQKVEDFIDRLAKTKNKKVKDSSSQPSSPSTPDKGPNVAAPPPSQNKEDDILQRQKRNLFSVRPRSSLDSLSEEHRDMFLSAIKWMMTERPEGDSGFSNYDIFVMKHRMAESQAAYSKEDKFKFHSEFLKRFEYALQEFNDSITLPYIDVCNVFLHQLPNTTYHLNKMISTPNVKVIEDCSWIGEKLKRSVSISSLTQAKLGEFFHCSNSSATLRSFGMDEYVAVHSIFGPCVTGGSHMACPSCAVSDPIFWLLYANIEMLLL